jgi:DNA-directed RNA polymerase subunit RPC12/RpoP
MGIKTKYHLWLVLLVTFCALAGGIAIGLNDPMWAISIPVAVVVFGVWGHTLRCMRCSTPYLHEMKDGLLIPKTFPERCRKCGLKIR